ncbi:MAG: MFS transporter, partial [Candidatus Dadabacteria bacterium]|nr:MFS transporter [Candidatus Dadabacteria bacterium]NIQ16005.1 MFS transporter [Candidatus Dadabacteria bacterium]
MKINISKLKPLIMSSVAIVFEWYDFLIFGFYAVYISKLFFPFQNQTTSLITTFIVFGISFLFRPLGAVVISNIGDRFGRKNAFIITVILMTFPTFLIGILPTYAQIGITATVLIIILRILQGFSLGGERCSTLSILVEMAPDNRRGLYTTFAGFSTMVGIVLASAVCGFISSKFTFAQMLEFGWRIPFLFGILTGLIAYYLRKNLTESSKFIDVKSSEQISENPIKEAIKYYRKEILITLFGTIVFAVGFYINFVYLITYSATIGKMELSSILKLNTTNMVIITILTPVFGYLGDIVGRKPLIITGALGMLATS